MLSDINDLVLPSPIQEINLPVLKDKKIKLLVKRDDLIHPWVSGNKYRKLKYNIRTAINNKYETIISFGGAFSNHLFALAGACALLHLKSVGIVRGEIDYANPTLAFCLDRGMKLIPLSRSAYREKEKSQEVIEILRKYSNPYLIPEGGTNQLALPGVSELLDELYGQMENNPDYIVLPCGTGGTTAGLLSNEKLTSQILAFSVLKTNHLEAEIQKISGGTHSEKLHVNTDFHFGGYARWDDTLINFIQDFEYKTGIHLDHVYNGKAMFGVIALIQSDYFKPGTTICYIHTGGLQGKEGLIYLHNKCKIFNRENRLIF